MRLDRARGLRARSRRVPAIACAARAALGLVLVGPALPARAHTDLPPAPHDLWAAWTLDPWILLPLALAGWLYARGVRRLWRRAGPGRGVRRWEAAAHAAGTLALWAALVSPLHELGEALFSAHMAQHTVMLLVAAPLLVAGRPVLAFVWALPPGWRRRAGRLARARPVRLAWRGATRPMVAWLVHALAVWVWHAPALYQATLASDLVHAAQHVSFLGAGVLFWEVVARGARGRAGGGVALLFVFTTAAHTGILGALLTFAPAPLYPAYSGRTEPWGLSLLEDQQLGGMLMWIPGGVVYLAAALVLFATLLRGEARGPARGGPASGPIDLRGRADAR